MNDLIIMEFTQSELLCVKDAMGEYKKLYVNSTPDVIAEIDGICGRLRESLIGFGGVQSALEEIFNKNI